MYATTNSPDQTHGRTPSATGFPVRRFRQSTFPSQVMDFTVFHRRLGRVLNSRCSHSRSKTNLSSQLGMRDFHASSHPYSPSPAAKPVVIKPLLYRGFLRCTAKLNFSFQSTFAP